MLSSTGCPATWICCELQHSSNLEADVRTLSSTSLNHVALAQVRGVIFSHKHFGLPSHVLMRDSYLQQRPNSTSNAMRTYSVEVESSDVVSANGRLKSIASNRIWPKIPVIVATVLVMTIVFALHLVLEADRRNQLETPFPSIGRTAKLLFMRHSIRADQSCVQGADAMTDNSDFCKQFQAMQNLTHAPFDPAIRNCDLVRQSIGQWYEKDHFVPDVFVTSPCLRTMQTAEVARRYYRNQHNISINRIIIDHRLSETWSAIQRDIRKATGDVESFNPLRKQRDLWPDDDVQIQEIEADIKQEAEIREQMMLEAVKDLWSRNENVFVVTHDAWITRLMDMCIGEHDNFGIPRHVSETTILMISEDGKCLVQYPEDKCHPTEFMNRPAGEPMGSMYHRHGSVIQWLEQ